MSLELKQQNLQINLTLSAIVNLYKKIDIRLIVCAKNLIENFNKRYF